MEDRVSITTKPASTSTVTSLSYTATGHRFRRSNQNNIRCPPEAGHYGLDGRRAVFYYTRVELPTIRAYERKAKDINKAQMDIVMGLANALKCEIRDLIG